jgi:asparagine synthase (glutamine-hydrolysing)
VIARHKQPYRAPDASSFFGAGSPDYVGELLSPDRIRRHGIFNPDSIARLVDKARSGNTIGVADNMAIVGVLSTQLLIEKFFKF